MVLLPYSCIMDTFSFLWLVPFLQIILICWFDSDNLVNTWIIICSISLFFFESTTPFELCTRRGIIPFYLRNLLFSFKCIHSIQPPTTTDILWCVILSPYFSRITFCLKTDKSVKNGLQFVSLIPASVCSLSSSLYLPLLLACSTLDSSLRRNCLPLGVYS